MYMSANKEALYEKQNSIDDTDYDINTISEFEKRWERLHDLQQDVDMDVVEEYEGNWSEPDL